MRRRAGQQVVALRRIAEAKPPEITGAEKSLIADVMKRKQTLRLLKKLFVTTARTKLGGCEATRPIVSMNYVGLPVKCLEQCECGAREECETNVIVVVTVDRRTCKEFGRFKKVRGRACCVAKPEAHVMNLTAPFNANVLDRTANIERSI